MTTKYPLVLNGTSIQELQTGDTISWSLLDSTPTTLSGYGISDAQPLDSDLTSIAALSGTSGLLKKTAANTWSLDTNTYLTDNQTITLTGDVTGSGTTSLALTLAASGVTAGTYTKVTVDSKGRTTSATTLSASDIPNLDAAKITSGTFDAARLPSYVDDVLEYAALASFPATGETGKIYVALDTNKTYRWSGSAYIYITSGAVDSVAGKTGVVTLVKADVGLGNVENTAISTWAGTANITTLGTITTGTWNATTISIAKGGTGSTDATTARTNLGVAIGSNVQAWDADLDAIAALAGTSGFLKKTAANTWTLDTSTYLTGITSGQVTTALGFTPYNATNPSGYTTNTGTVTSVGMTVPTGLSVSGTPVTGSGTLAITLTAGYSIPTTASQTNWDTAYTDRNKWDGGATGLVAATGRTSLGLGTAATMAGPTGTIVGTTDTQTLTNKTLTGYTETVYAVSGTTPALTPTNGSIQTWILSGNSTPSAGTWNNGQSITLMINDGSAYTITWSTLSVTWKTNGGTAPTLNTSGYTAITLWKTENIIYGARVGDA